jgi:uncharacterized protein YutE (UPF0331/DUF86 family)
MRDPELIQKKLRFVETCIEDIRTLGRPDHIADDKREQRFIEHTLQLAIQACMDVASLVISELSFGEPESNRQFFELLSQRGWLPKELAAKMTKIVGFRNVLVHRYQQVDLAIVKHAATAGLADLQAFVDAIGTKLSG